MRKFRNVLIGLLCVAAVVALIVLLDGAPESFRAKYEGADLTTDVTGIGRTDTYDGYLRAHEDAPAVSEAVLVDVAAFEGDATLEKDDEGNEFVYTPDNSYVTWKVDVKACLRGQALHFDQRLQGLPC